ncbi:uncharacterized protein (TIGR03083 family) [Saccharopolyspora lacisalsi]|uniref:Uncharacterized protein (TIGR03083 family) n=1 Tax=Halosaccharopolyspora lacisalsi TaxID=1000566 RepID=A0A839E1K5_9PSEU|nr:maleylpyruvate isomerase N-terminal domain-containing protein [Halosaccharopolyspora lacisalsi]MBA8825281.1 uncharacterized protein (TIGR03083 family) [Halosaccharopolyspora lacisalsi]
MAWRAWAELGEKLDDEQWSRPTRLEGWNAKHVYAHHSGFPAGLVALNAAPPARGALTHTSSAELLADMQRAGGPADAMADQLRHQAVEHAAAHSTSELVEAFTTTAPRAIAECEQLDPTRPIDYTGMGIVPRGEAGRIVLMEAVVHYFDIASALGMTMPGPMAGEPVRDTTLLLAEVADPVALIEAATGRGEPPVFPVLR